MTANSWTAAIRRQYLIQFCISHEINLAENTMKLYSGSLILTYVLWCSRYDKKWALASTTGTAPCTTTPIIKNLIGWARTTNCTAHAASYLEQFRAVLCKNNNKNKNKSNNYSNLKLPYLRPWSQLEHSMVFVSAQKSGCNVFCRMKTRCVDNEVVTTRQMFHSLCDVFRIILSSWEPYIKTVT